MNPDDGETDPAPAAADPVRIGLVGAGNVAAKHVRAAQDVPEARFVGVCDARRSHADDFGRSHGIPSYDDVADVVERSGAEAIIVAVPTAAHAEVAREVIGRGAHVLVEKPMATTVEDCDAIIAAADEAGVIVGVCHMMQRRHRRLQAGKRIVDSGSMGGIVMMNCRRTANYSRPGRPAWMFDPEAAGGGVMINTGTYAIEEFQWLAGAMVRSVSGLLPRSGGRHIVETNGAALLELDGGIMASVVELGNGYPATEELDIVLERGSLRLSHAGGLWQYQDGAGEQVVAPPRPPDDDYGQAMSYQLADFARAVRSGVPPATDGVWGRSVVAAAAAIYSSARTGAPVLVR